MKKVLVEIVYNDSEYSSTKELVEKINSLPKIAVVSVTEC